MKTTVIPAQVTTVEDTIAGNLTLSQIVLFIIAIFLATSIYSVVPSPLKLSVPKVFMIVICSGVCLTLSIRLKGKLMLHWVLLITSYTVRSHRYVYNKNSFAGRVVTKEISKKTIPHPHTKHNPNKHTSPVIAFDYQQLLRSTKVQLSIKQGKILIARSL
jgi:hypothetical protein